MLLEEKNRPWIDLNGDKRYASTSVPRVQAESQSRWCAVCEKLTPVSRETFKAKEQPTCKRCYFASLPKAS